MQMGLGHRVAQLVAMPLHHLLMEGMAGAPTEHGYQRPTWTQELLILVAEKKTGLRVSPTTMGGSPYNQTFLVSAALAFSVKNFLGIVPVDPVRLYRRRRRWRRVRDRRLSGFGGERLARQYLQGR